jgi:predicted metalloprotease
MLARMRRPLLAATLVCTCILAACGSTGPGLTASRSDDLVDITLPVTQDTMEVPDSTVPPNPNDAAIDFGTNKEPQPYDDFLQIALADVQDYWRATYPETYGSPYIELSGGIWASYPGREGNPIPEYPNGCRGDPAEQYIAEQNAFYCGLGDYMAYDDFNLIPSLVEAYGQSAVGVVFAHEFGHAIQARVGSPGIVDAPGVYGEQQADCFAGAWTAHVARGESANITFGDDDIRAGLSAMVAVKDPLIVPDENGQPTSVNVLEGNAHGTAFDRVGAFENGFLGGAAACKEMETTPLPLLNLQFGDPTDLANEGNTPYDGDEANGIDPLPVLLEADLGRFWTGAVSGFAAPTMTSYPHDGPYPECDDVDDSAFSFGVFYCPSTNTVLYDEGFTRALYRIYGDFSVGYVISNAWSEAAQTELGSSLDGEKRVLINECLTGAWTKDIIPTGSDAQAFSISPGDLDEAVETALVLGTEGLADDNMGSAFEKIEFFRAGVLGGVGECNNRITNS